MGTGERRSGRVLLALLATVVGWLAGIIYYLGVGFAIDPLGLLGALPVIALWTGIISLLAWLLFFAPLVLLLPTESRVFRPVAFTGVGAVMGFVAFVALVTWWAPLWHWFYVLYGVVVGAASAWLFTVGRSYARRLRHAS